MSAKDEFFKKVIDNNNAEKAEAAAKQKELEDFIHDSSQLLSRIQFWFDEAESNITVEKSRVNINNENKLISVQCLSLTNRGKKLTICPGPKGVIKVSMGSTDVYANDEYTLCSLLWNIPNTTDSTWTISYQNNNREHLDLPFNEENFFKFIADFA